MRIALISCTKLKRPGTWAARDLYLPSDLFSKARAYVEASGYDAWYILSAKCGLTDPSAAIASYEVTLADLTRPEQDAWARRVYWDLAILHGLAGTRIDVFAGEIYRRQLVPLLEAEGATVQVPMRGLGIGEQKKWLRDRTPAAVA